MRILLTAGVGGGGRGSTLEGSDGEEEVATGEVEAEDGGGLGAVAGQQHLLAVPPHVGVVGHVHVLQAALRRQIPKVPDGDGRV